ncbi:hypothetical protein L596_021075 [Steinernema carpocapsae]|uniref:Uncharacterized protein n=1 Tax=Steinernema carpocapsae TaxID=34508 RepID=A0A4U5MVC7_STECR|nr:hypothetical protein L596_021075 [Steinernema carpocapsae]
MGGTPLLIQMTMLYFHTWEHSCIVYNVSVFLALTNSLAVNLGTLSFKCYRLSMVKCIKNLVFRFRKPGTTHVQPATIPVQSSIKKL